MIGTLTSNIQNSLNASKCKLLSCDYWFELNSISQPQDHLYILVGKTI